MRWKPAGAQGAAGAAGPQGPAGPFPDVLPRGKTLTGVYSVTGVATAADQYADSPVSFGFRFSSAPTVQVVGIADTAQQAAAAGCPGSAADPQAAPGKVCIYEMGRANTKVLTNVKEAGGGDTRISAYAPPNLTFGTAMRHGTIIEIHSAAAGNMYSNGSWAATSP